MPRRPPCPLYSALVGEVKKQKRTACNVRCVVAVVRRVGAAASCRRSRLLLAQSDAPAPVTAASSRCKPARSTPHGAPRSAAVPAWGAASAAPVVVGGPKGDGRSMPSNNPPPRTYRVRCGNRHRQRATAVRRYTSGGGGGGSAGAGDLRGRTVVPPPPAAKTIRAF